MDEVDGDYERIEVFSTRLDAEMARSALEAHGISAAVAADDGGGTGFAMSLDHQGVELRVARADRAEARQVLGLREPVPAPPGDRPAWVVITTSITVLFFVALLILQVVTN